jgi:ankyrin repeat protein
MKLRFALSVLILGHLLCSSSLALAQSAADENLSVNARFLVAARNADAAAMARGLKDGAAINSRNRLGETALVVVLKKKRSDLAQMLVEGGADVNLAAINGITPLMSAAFNGDAPIVRQLLAKGADPAALDRLRKTAMIYAAGEGQTEVVQLLLARGVDVNAVYGNDLTALMWAAGFDRSATVKALLEAGARTDLKDNRGKTAADIARAEKFAATAALIDSAQPRAAAIR